MTTTREEQRDVVERLRKIADAARREDGSDIPLGECCREAAAEITRLRSTSQAGGVPAGDIAKELARWMPDAFSSVNSIVEDCPSIFPDDFSAREVNAFRLVAEKLRAMLSASPPPPATDGDALLRPIATALNRFIQERTEEALDELCQQVEGARHISSLPFPATDGDALRDALEDCAEYFDQRADADQPTGCSSPIPNEEMSLLIKVRNALASVSGTDAVEVAQSATAAGMQRIADAIRSRGTDGASHG